MMRSADLLILYTAVCAGCLLLLSMHHDEAGLAMYDLRQGIAQQQAKQWMVTLGRSMFGTGMMRKVNCSDQQW